MRHHELLPEAHRRRGDVECRGHGAADARDVLVFWRADGGGQECGECRRDSGVIEVLGLGLEVKTRWGD